MMPKMGDHCLHMNHFHDDSLKEALKMKMLNQEDTFKKQVQELHRLYQIQIMLTKNLQWNEVVTRQSVNCASQGIWRRPLDAKMSASGYVKHRDQHFLNKGDGWGTRENPVQVEYYCPGDIESSLDEIKLSLSIGRDTMQKRSRRKIWHEKFTSISSQEIIDLEESSHTELSTDIEPMSALVCTAGSADSGNLHGTRSNYIYVNGREKDSANGIMRCESFIDESNSCLEQNCLNQGVTKWFGELPGVDISPASKVSTSHDALCLDLNKPLPDESLFDSMDLAMESSAGACSGVTEKVTADIHRGLSPDGTSWRIGNNNCSNEVSAIIEEDTPNFTIMASNSGNSSTNTRGGKALSPDLESSLRSPSDCHESHEDLTGNSLNKDAELRSKFSGRHDKGKTVIGMNDAMAEKNAMLSHLCCRADPVERMDSSPASCKSDNIAMDRTCSLKTVQSGIYLGNSDLSHINSSPDSESSQNESPSLGESKSGSFDERKEGSAHDDSVVQRGAMSLMFLFLESSRREHECVAEFDKATEIENGKRDQPQCSADTFESMVLKLQETNTEDYCVTSNPSEVISTDTKDYGVKLRRGRRMKDFQKDILPSLASLSRHEISEDIRIMEGVIRSREYKRLRSKKSIVQNWFTPVRSRRSRLNYVGRKFYS